MNGIYWDNGDLVLRVRVQPKAASDGFDVRGDRLKIRITAPPVDGKANQHLIRFLAKTLGVAKSAVVIEAGENGRDKRIRVRAAPTDKVKALPLPPSS